MNRYEGVDREVDLGGESAAEKAERIVSDSERRGERASPVMLKAGDSAPMLDDPAPLSSALHIPTLLPERDGERAPERHPDNPAPLSAALGLPTLLEEPKREPVRLRRDDPAPFSRLLGLPVLLNESKPER